ncbi:hypothetical protein KC340_g10164 [Hortaea werneckii]|nr:hypothetical protein KC342_g8139 [Hortaea werneckii]KAI7074477.1 hypothetical protein KC339_g14068 [Hortaea werneckii]KAI7225449.1 hypothetical protein KC365_g9973 [Hortaea werneckii]KAI7311429.1 hypothetical protein KC340_g10164 [Hortaea werneckii]KAI7385199.1 hypothetical protein KC328_g10441 [Hortaea werneckii]
MIQPFQSYQPTCTMSNVNQEQHHQSTGGVDRQRFPADNRNLLAQYMDQCDRMASLLMSLRDDVRDDFKEYLNTVEKPGSVGEVSRAPARETSSPETADHERFCNAMNGNFESPGGRISRLGDGIDIAEGSGSQDSEKEAQAK